MFLEGRNIVLKIGITSHDSLKEKKSKHMQDVKPHA